MSFPKAHQSPKFHQIRRGDLWSPASSPPTDEIEVFCSVKRKTYDLRLNFQLSIFNFQLSFQTLHYIIYARAVGFVGRSVGALIGTKAKSEVKKIVQNDGVMEKN